jgi:uncharacterized protein YecE (DUF72 family)
MMQGEIHIGTSGWSYKHWNGVFYPPELKPSRHFDFYAKTFDSVEINNSFYRLPAKSVFDMWRRAAPRGFLFAVKASRFVTHMKKLNLDREGISKLFSHTDHLKETLGPILFQLPPHWKVNTERLRSFLGILPTQYQYAMEFRNPTWYCEEVYQILEQFNVAFCIYELEQHLSPLKVTADFVYIRLHGPGAKYQGSYSDEVLKEWAVRMRRWRRQGKNVFIYFDNDQAGYAAFNAATLRGMFRRTKSV